MYLKDVRTTQSWFTGFKDLHPNVSLPAAVKKSGLFASLPAPKSQSGSSSGLFASLPPPKSQGGHSPEERPTKKKREPIVFTVSVPEKVCLHGLALAANTWRC